MNSLRDVADEVLYDEKWKIDRGEFFYPDELPEGHLFSQASPGSLWEKDGVNYLTMGINLWDNGSEQLALQSRPTGQWMKEDAITLFFHQISVYDFCRQQKITAELLFSASLTSTGCDAQMAISSMQSTPIGMEEHSALNAVRTPAQLVSSAYVPTATSIHLTTSVGSIMVRRVAIEMRN